MFLSEKLKPGMACTFLKGCEQASIQDVFFRFPCAVPKGNQEEVVPVQGAEKEPRVCMCMSVTFLVALYCIPM